MDSSLVWSFIKFVHCLIFVKNLHLLFFEIVNYSGNVHLSFFSLVFVNVWDEFYSA